MGYRKFFAGATTAAVHLLQSRPLTACSYTVAALLALHLVLAQVPSNAAGPIGAVAGIFAKIVLIFMVAAPLQLLIPAVRRPPKLFTSEFWWDVCYWHQGLLLSLLSFWMLVSAARDFVWGWTSGPWWQGAAALPLWAQILLVIVAHDFIVYWRHRCEHAFRVLWAFHAVHHGARQIDVLTTLRVHPLELLVGAVANFAVVLIGFDPIAVGAGFTIYLHWNYFIHTNARIRFGGPFKYLLVSPFMHQWHHAVDRAAMGKNVGVVFAWNDWLFGTAYHPKHWPTEFGIDAPAPERMPRGYLRQLFYPVQYACAQWQYVRAARRADRAALRAAGER